MQMVSAVRVVKSLKEIYGCLWEDDTEVNSVQIELGCAEWTQRLKIDPVVEYYEKENKISFLYVNTYPSRTFSYILLILFFYLHLALYK